MRIFIIVLSLLFLSCASYKSFITSDNICNYNSSLFYIKNEEYSASNIDYKNKKKNFVLFENKEELEKLILWGNEEPITVTKYMKKSRIGKSIEYDYSTGKILNIEFFYLDGLINIGQSKYFDEQGNITKVIDHETGYKICWKEAIEIVKHKFRRKLAKYDSVSYVLYRPNKLDFPNHRPRWSVGIIEYPEDKIDETTYYKIDGITGKYLGKYTLRMGMHN